MNALLQLIDISYSHSHQTLFEGLNFSINQKDKIGLVGHNGSGKSTLLALIAGKRDLASGEIRKPNSVRIGIVEQFVSDRLKSSTLIDSVIDALPTDDKLAHSWKAETQLMQLGFSKSQFEVPVRGLSGGQQNLMLIARAIVQEPDLLLMDEPGNHMDIKAMSRLEAFLNTECRCPFLIISHDQHLLDNVCTKTVFLRDKKTYPFELAFSKAKVKLDEEDRVAQKHRHLEEKEIARLKATAKRLAVWGRENDNEDLSRKAKSIEKRAEKLNLEKTEVTQGSKLKLALNDHSLSAKQILAIENCIIKTPDNARQLLEIDQVFIQPGDRVALLGINGVGKSSSLETIRKRFYSGQFEADDIRFNPRTALGYYDQELISFNSDSTRIDWLRKNTRANEEQLKRTLINAGVAYQDFSRKVNTLSGGEKSRMMFLAFSLNQPNFLILDEPTNHIDLEGKQELTEQLVNSGATMIITSHDRHFLDSVATRWLLIEKQKIVEVCGPELFYETLTSNTNQQQKGSACLLSKSENLSCDEEAILLRIEELESKLSEDKKRKVKFQKIKLQIEWQNELAELWHQIN